MLSECLALLSIKHKQRILFLWIFTRIHDFSLPCIHIFPWHYDWINLNPIWNISQANMPQKIDCNHKEGWWLLSECLALPSIWYLNPAVKTNVRKWILFVCAFPRIHDFLCTVHISFHDIMSEQFKMLFETLVKPIWQINWLQS